MQIRSKLEKSDRDIVVGFSVPYLFTDQDREVKAPEAKLRSISFLAAVMEKVWENNPYIHLWLVGEPSRSVRAFSKNHPQVRLLGYVPHMEVLNYYTNFDIAVYPRLVDLSGRHSIKLVEFMAAGLPIVSTPVAESFHVKQSGAGIIVEGLEAFAKAILYLQAYPEMRTNLGNKGKEYGAQFDWDYVGHRYEREVLAVYTNSVFANED